MAAHWQEDGRFVAVLLSVIVLINIAAFFAFGGKADPRSTAAATTQVHVLGEDDSVALRGAE